MSHRPNTDCESSRLICDVPPYVGTGKVFAWEIVKPDYSVFAFGISAGKTIRGEKHAKHEENARTSETNRNLEVSVQSARNAAIVNLLFFVSLNRASVEQSRNSNRELYVRSLSLCELLFLERAQTEIMCEAAYHIPQLSEAQEARGLAQV